MAKNWLGSEEGMVLKTATIAKNNEKAVVENGRKIVKSGTLINDTDLGLGLLYNDVDVTDENRVASIMIAGFYIDENLPQTVAESASALASRGLHAVKYAKTNVTYGEVTK